MTKLTDSTTNTIPSSNNVTTTVILPPRSYEWDGIKRTRKAAYTHYLSFYNKDYTNCPRRLKKVQKHRAVRILYYSKGRIYIFNPLMLSTPVPKAIFDLFKVHVISPISWHCMKFRRYNMKGDHD